MRSPACLSYMTPADRSEHGCRGYSCNYTGPSMVPAQGGSGPPDYDRFFKIVNDLIDMERKAKKK